VGAAWINLGFRQLTVFLKKFITAAPMPSMALLKQLLRIFSPSERWQLIGMLLLIILGACLETFSVGVIPAFVALLSQPNLIENHTLLQQFYIMSRAETIYGFMLILSVILLLIFLGKNIYLAFLANYQYRFLRHKHVSFISKLFSLYLHAPYTFHLQRNSADIGLTLVSEAHQLFWNILLPLSVLISEIIVISFIVTLLIFFEPISSLIAVGFLGAALFLFNQWTRKTTRWHGQIRQFHDSKVYLWVNQGLASIKETKFWEMEHFFGETFSFHKEQSVRSAAKLELIKHYSQLYIETVVISAVLLLVIITLLQEKALQDILPMLSLFAIAALRIMPSAKRIASHMTSLRFFSHAVTRVVNEF
jgi:ABC-type multidrug transport system fused ATPase/permease subunit